MGEWRAVEPRSPGHGAPSAAPKPAMGYPALGMPEPLVAAHQHFWDVDAFNYPLLDRPGGRVARRYYVADLVADAANWPLVKSVHLQGEIGREHTLQETEWLQKMA